MCAKAVNNTRMTIDDAREPHRVELRSILALVVGASSDLSDVSINSSYHTRSAIVVTAVAPNRIYPLLTASRTVMTELQCEYMSTGRSLNPLLTFDRIPYQVSHSRKSMINKRGSEKSLSSVFDDRW